MTGLLHRDAPPLAGGPGPHPALVLLHGRGADENDLRGLVPALDPRFHVFSVRAPRPFTWGGGYAWYDVEEIGRPIAAQFQESLSLLSDFISGIAVPPIDPSRVFLLGFSMGAVMAHAIALSNPDAIAGVVAHSGYLPDEKDTGLRIARERLEGRPWFVAHGTEDPLLPIHLGRESRDRLSTLGVDLTYREYPIGHWISEESLADLSAWLTGHLDAQERKR
jgi:phospholipase/carboxylesterase